MNRILDIENRSKKRIHFNGYTLVPFSQSVRFLASKHGGIIWNRPESLLVKSPEGDEKVLPVNDPTRLLILIIMGLTFLVTLILSAIGARNNRRNNERRNVA